MRILVCNDDGIDAPGLKLLEEVARRLSDDVRVVAPDGKRTAASASITIGRPLTIQHLGDNRYSCSGTPADCVVTSMTWLFKDGTKPDLVLSGINDGRNTAEDLAYSGTLGIAREATFWGIPAIGFSRVKNPDLSPNDADFLARFVRDLWKTRETWLRDGHWLSVNLPVSLPAPVRQPRIGRDKIGTVAQVLSEEADKTVLIVPRGRAHASTSGDENDLIDQGNICINRLNWFGETPLKQKLLELL
ncbi:5'/3'-nucleotidase SurE [Phyllobacterium phragmitis]|uniref:5'-nucleotidase n=1 Tax=Phyllobacterium phragmitis TaxID=2670329 RepID=A0A2S9IU55_9HYPH|nr:5'/3'-nucleotidase SurE [Phyllobacterium phragmitis]PRD44048.1 5'/3'-nucleotidase SurE [Phyllobacterium phragmitis]